MVEYYRLSSIFKWGIKVFASLVDTMYILRINPDLNIYPLCFYLSPELWQ